MKLKFIHLILLIAVTNIFSFIPIAKANENKNAGRQILDIRIIVKNDFLFIEGSAKNNKDIADCLVRLENSNLFKAVILRNLKSINNLKTFKIRCKIHSRAGKGKTALSNEKIIELVHKIVSSNE